MIKISNKQFLLKVIGNITLENNDLSNNWRGKITQWIKC